MYLFERNFLEVTVPAGNVQRGREKMNEGEHCSSDGDNAIVLILLFKLLCIVWNSDNPIVTNRNV